MDLHDPTLSLRKKLKPKHLPVKLASNSGGCLPYAVTKKRIAKDFKTEICFNSPIAVKLNNFLKFLSIWALSSWYSRVSTVFYVYIGLCNSLHCAFSCQVCQKNSDITSKFCKNVLSQITQQKVCTTNFCHGQSSFGSEPASSQTLLQN